MGFPWLSSSLGGGVGFPWPAGQWLGGCGLPLAMLQAVRKLWASLEGWTTGFTSSISLCREPPARTPASGSQPQHPAALPVVWKLHQALQPKKRVSLVPARGQPLRNGLRRHLSPRRSRAQLLRVGCALGTCQVQNLSHRLWQLVGSAGPRASAPVDPSSPHSYG